MANIQAALDAATSFVVECGVQGPYTQTWVMPKHDFSVFDMERTTNYVSVMFAADVATARQLFSRQDDHEFDFREICKLMGDYVTVGKLPGSKLHDLHRNGIIYGISEDTELVSTLLGTYLGPYMAQLVAGKTKH